MKKTNLFMILVIICLSVMTMTISLFATDTTVSNIVFSKNEFKMFLSGTDHKTHPGFFVQFPYNTKSAYYKFLIDGEEQEIEIFERNIVNNDTEIKFQSLYDTDYEFDLLDTQQIKNVVAKGYNTNNVLVEQGEFQLVIPAKPKITKILVNNQMYSENMQIINPVKIDIFTNAELAKNKLLNNILLLQNNNNKIMCDYELIDNNHIRISAKEALLPNTKTQLLIKKYLTDVNNISVYENDTFYSLSITSQIEKPLLVDSVEIDNKKILTENSVNSFNNPQQLAITFNQLINYNNFILSDIDTNSLGIYIREKNIDNSSARLIDPEFSIISENGIYKSKVVFKMVGKMGYFSHDPLKNNTNYEIVIEKKLVSESNTNLSGDIIYEFMTNDVVSRSYTLDSDDNVMIFVNNQSQPKQTQIFKGTTVKLKAKNKPGFKFLNWQFSRNFEESFIDEYNVVKSLLNNLEIEFQMPATDLYVSVEYVKMSEEEKLELEKRKAELIEFINNLGYINLDDKQKYVEKINKVDDVNRLLPIKEEAINQHIENYKKKVMSELLTLNNLDAVSRDTFIKELNKMTNEQSILALLNRAREHKVNNSNFNDSFTPFDNNKVVIKKVTLPKTGVK